MYRVFDHICNFLKREKKQPCSNDVKRAPLSLLFSHLYLLYFPRKKMSWIVRFSFARLLKEAEFGDIYL